VGEEKGTGELGRTEGRSSRGQRHGEASVSLAEVGCKRQEGVKGEADDINRDRSLRGYVPCDPAGRRFHGGAGELWKRFQIYSQYSQLCLLKRYPVTASEAYRAIKMLCCMRWVQNLTSF
jgi:hypothetical protein